MLQEHLAISCPSSEEDVTGMGWAAPWLGALINPNVSKASWLRRDLW